MSRRESRASIGVRQNDALYEFEAFKKKFLLANKHITKLNSTLSVRIEELNAQLHALNVENLRLRTSEIQLASELKREREKSRKVMAEAEAATHSLTRHLNHLRSTLEIPRISPAPATPPSPKARQRPPPPDPTVESLSPQGMRIARPPTIPGIHEDDEPEEEADPPTPPKRKSKTKPRLSASNLPLPTGRISTPPPEPNNVLVDLSVAVASSTSSKRKQIRRQSGLLTVTTQAPLRPASPAFGTPQEAMAVEIDEDKESKKRAKSKEQIPVPPPKDRKRRREDDDSHIVTVEAVTTKMKQHGRAALQPIDNTIHDQYDDLVSHGKQFLTAHQRESLSPSPVISVNSELEPEGSGDAAGRERRARKSVNYAEPKLNTKMRRPEGSTTVTESRKKRSSAAATTSNFEAESQSTPEQQARDSPAPQLPATDGVTTVRRKKSRPQVYHFDDDDEEESDGGDVDEEYAPPGRTLALKRASGRRGESEGRRHSMAV